MRNGFLKVAAATPEIAVNGTHINRKNIISQIKEAYENGCKAVVFPELCITGYTCGDLFLQADTEKRAREALSKILKETKGMDILFIVGLPICYCDKLYNVAAVCKDGRVLGFVPKTNLPNYAEFNEVRYFSTSSKTAEVSFEDYTVPMGTKLIFCARQMEEFRFACELCEDMWTAVSPSAQHSQNGAVLIFNISANAESPGKGQARRLMVASNSAKQLSAYIYAEAGDGESTTDLVYAGHNMIYEGGKCLAEAKPFENGIVYGTVDTEKLCFLRKQRNTFETKNDDEYTRIYFDTELEETSLCNISKTPFIPADRDAARERSLYVFKMQTKGLEKRLKHIGAKTVTIGVSGGLDSTLALLVAAQTFDDLKLDRKNIIAVSMPCFGTSDRTYNNSKRICDVLGVSYKEINIENAVKQHFADIGLDEDDRGVTYENAQARERTQILMDIANKTGGIVIGTGDLSELALGFATYNGDHMSMYGVNCSVPKTLMREVVGFVAAEYGEDAEAVLKDIVETPVSPELLPADDSGEIAQKTEDIIGPYEVHDFILYYYAKYGFSREKIMRMAECAFQGVYNKESLDKWFDTFFRRFFANQFKRSAAPDGVKAGSISLSQRGSYVMPSDAIFE